MPVLYALLAVTAVTLLLLFLIFRKTFYAPRRRGGSDDLYRMPPGFGEMDPTMRRLVSELDARPHRRLTITARDGTRLSARYHHVADGAPLEIQCHGYRGRAVRDFCGGNPLAAEMGHNTLLIDQRAHGESGGHCITFGIRERFDILDWVDYATRELHATEILLVGISMGGASVLMAGGEPLPTAVRGIIADCPYSSPRDIISSVIRMMHLSPRVAYPLVAASARLFGGFSLSACTAVAAAARCPVPILLLHGEEDRLVPAEMSRRIAAAAGVMATLVTFPGADHGMSYMSDPDRYRAVTAAFCQKCLARKESLT